MEAQTAKTAIENKLDVKPSPPAIPPKPDSMKGKLDKYASEEIKNKSETEAKGNGRNKNYRKGKSKKDDKVYDAKEKKDMSSIKDRNDVFKILAKRGSSLWLFHSGTGVRLTRPKVEVVFNCIVDGQDIPEQYKEDNMAMKVPDKFAVSTMKYIDFTSGTPEMLAIEKGKDYPWEVKDTFTPKTSVEAKCLHSADVSRANTKDRDTTASISNRLAMSHKASNHKGLVVLLAPVAATPQLMFDKGKFNKGPMTMKPVDSGTLDNMVSKGGLWFAMMPEMSVHYLIDKGALIYAVSAPEGYLKKNSRGDKTAIAEAEAEAVLIRSMVKKGLIRGYLDRPSKAIELLAQSGMKSNAVPEVAKSEMKKDEKLPPEVKKDLLNTPPAT